MSTLSTAAGVKRAASALQSQSARLATKPAKAVRRHVTVEYERGGDQKDATTKNAPPQWEATWTELHAMRKRHVAPVDSIGCDSFYDVDAVRQRHPEVHGDAEAAKRLARFRVLVSLMLSSQTKDQETAKAMQRLIAWGLTVDRLAAVPDAELNAMIANVGFHNKKVGYLKRTAADLALRFDSDVPKTLQDLISLPGVGMKMAHLALQSAWNLTLGISVDTHVHRIANRLGWTKNARTPGQTAEQLEAWLPHRYWHDVNHTLVGLG
jgi:endonuclease-3